ncbi:hypothetical protein BAE44_0011960 [Dichanthelium oligosanthes]|uniref:MATH domain-containing protein n=1 Tax=Dichanthelium oligosanthes TaxID=888268 RepID=A0A1E5VPF8_9POAL|nr:hypothetical protein BAE44_0011960 [Dichanthelium oligosanthes]
MPEGIQKVSCEEEAVELAMGNSCVTGAPHALLEKIGDPDSQWKIYGFSSLLEKGATIVTSDVFHCCGYECLDMLRSIWLIWLPSPFIYEQLATTSMSRIGTQRKKCLIPLEEILKSSDFLVDDSCVFGVRILKADISFARKKTAVVLKKSVVVPKKPMTFQNLFLQKKEFIKGTYTWTMNNFLDLKLSVLSPAFEVGGYKWCIKMYPRGDQSSTKSLSLYLCMDKPSTLSLEPGMMIELTLSILNQKNGKHHTGAGRFAFAGTNAWGWPNFIPRWMFKDRSFGYLVGSNCIVKADIAIVGSSIDG